MLALIMRGRALLLPLFIPAVTVTATASVLLARMRVWLPSHDLLHGVKHLNVHHLRRRPILLLLSLLMMLVDVVTLLVLWLLLILLVLWILRVLLILLVPLVVLVV